MAAHLDPKGTIEKVVNEYDRDTDSWNQTYYITDGNTDPPSLVIYTRTFDSGPTAGADALDDIQGVWSAAHP